MRPNNFPDLQWHHETEKIGEVFATTITWIADILLKMTCNSLVL